MTVPVLQVKKLYKLFIPLEHSQNEKKAMTMLEQGASRTEVQEATGITAGLIDINLQSTRARYLSSSVFPAAANPLLSVA